MGFKVRDAHKFFKFSMNPFFDTNPRFTSLAPLSSIVGSTANPNPAYYFGNYKLAAALQLRQDSFLPSTPNRNQFIETVDFEHLIFRL